MAHSVSGAALNPIYERLNTAPRYHPIEAETFADWTVEAGDIITVTRDGQSYQSPVQESVVKWKKGQQVSVSSGGNETRDAVSKVSQNKYNNGIGGGSGLRNTGYLSWSIERSYNEMRAGLIVTASSLSAYVENKYTQMTSGLKLTASSAHLYVDSKYTQMTSGLKLTASSAHLYVDSKYTQMASGLKLTASSAHLYVDSKYTQMTSGLKLTASSAHLYVDSKYTQMASGLKLTASSAHLYVDNKYTQMTSGLKLSESSLHAYVESKYTQMQSGLQLTEDSAAIYARSRTTKAAIIARINGDGRSEALIEADRVSVTGTTTINDVMIIAESRVRITQPLRVIGDAMVETLTIRDGSSSDTITQSDLAGMIKSASVSGNTLTLTPVHGDPITFRKAITSWIQGWSNGRITVTAQPQNQSKTFPAISVSGPNSITSNNTYTYKVMYEDADGNDQETGCIKTITVDVPTQSVTPTADTVSAQPSTYQTSGKYQAGSVSKSQLAAPGYISFKVHAGGTTREYYIVVNP